MYLKPRRRQRRRGFPFRRLFGLLLIGLLGAGVFYALQNRETLEPIVRDAYATLSANVNDTVSTIAAPTPTPTEDPSTNLRLAEAAWSSGSYQEAVRLYEDSIRALPNDVRAHYYLTLGLIMQGRITDAVESAENTVTANPFSPDAWAIRSMALNRAERYPDSIVSALRALELDPESVRARAFLAESYLDSGQITRGEGELEAALEADPDSYEARYVSGMYLSSLGDYLTAREELQNAYDVSGGAAHIGLNLARLQQIAFQDLEGATAILEDILNRNPDNAAVLFQLGFWAWRNNGNSEQAETYLRRCTTAAPDNVPCHYELGRVLYNLNQTEDARRAFERVIELGSTDPYHFYWAGQVQIQASADCPAAMRFWQQGMPILQNLISTGSNLYTSAMLEELLSNYQTVMAPCGGAPVPLPTATPEGGEGETTEEGA
ncbi:MAG: tetratricopeptide repeat protein [Anaerolineae bacterium]|jgi:tetratricopeptide (TPR) repeat protein|nr:tetratricopeptide repeat protein [Anaerolineae bacterium]